jgi:hypothetical protein
MAEIGLQGSVGQRVAADMPEPVGVDLEPNLGLVAGARASSLANPEGGVFAAELLDFDGLRRVRRLPPKGETPSKAD